MLYSAQRWPHHEKKNVGILQLPFVTIPFNPAHRGYEFEFLPPALHHTYQVMPMRSSMRRPRQSAGQEQPVVYAWQRARGKVER